MLKLTRIGTFSPDSEISVSISQRNGLFSTHFLVSYQGYRIYRANIAPKLRGQKMAEEKKEARETKDDKEIEISETENGDGENDKPKIEDDKKTETLEEPKKDEKIIDISPPEKATEIKEEEKKEVKEEVAKEEVVEEEVEKEEAQGKEKAEEKKEDQTTEKSADPKEAADAEKEEKPERIIEDKHEIEPIDKEKIQEELPPSSPPKKKKINKMTLAEIEKKLKEVEEHQGGFDSRYARHLLKRKKTLVS